MNAFTESFSVLYERDLNVLIKELSLYNNESDMWKVSGDIKNSGGNLAMHLAGNLRHFFGHVMGKGDYKRDRNFELGGENIPRNKIVKEIEISIVEVKNVLDNITNEDLQSTFPINVFKYEMTTANFITHLYGHLNYHLGQINYHRRLIEKQR